ncbi:MAG: tetratricopeptide repeat protein [Phycisphaerae bacterium]|nr:tetratricopeptide repeat protein [Phycisphaerae bacterium]
MQAQRCNARGLQHVEQQEYPEAEEAFRAALEADLFYPAAHNNLGLVLLQQKRFYDAAWEFQFAMKLAPRSAEPRSNLGLVMEHVGRLDEAEGYYKDALSIEPENVAVMGHLARVYVKTQKQPAELETLLKDLALRSEGEDWQVWARQQLLKLGRPVEDE